MPDRIDLDLARFHERSKKLGIEALKKQLAYGPELPNPHGETLRIPVKLRLPRFMLADRPDGTGVGSGEGGVGCPASCPETRRGSADYGADRMQKPEALDYAELTKEEAAEVLGETLNLPDLLKIFGEDAKSAAKGERGAKAAELEALGSRRLLKKALLRALASGDYDPEDPVIAPLRYRKHYRRPKQAPSSRKAAVIYALDHSANMNWAIDFLRSVVWWADAWIGKHYERAIRRYLHYGGEAREVDADGFFKTKGGGGTSMRAGLELAKRMAAEYAEDRWDLYLIHFTDGDYSGLTLGEKAANPLTDCLLGRCNGMFVCEAGPYYGHEESEDFARPRNYSFHLRRLIDAAPPLRKRVRYASFVEKEIRDCAKQKAMETLRNWFR
jgi:hypothetical protein